MNTHVIILAQGSQKRLIGVQCPKQLLTLPAHAAHKAPNTQILGRTIMQVATILAQNESRPERKIARWIDQKVTVVASPRVKHELDVVRIPLIDIETRKGAETPSRMTVLATVVPSFCTLGDPGNSSIKGLSRYLAAVDDTEMVPHIVVLLGDVVYSWACLEALFRPAHEGDVTFAGSSDLGPDRGELWGIAWYRSCDRMMRSCLASGLAASSKHEDEYQPGQLRHWLWQVDRHLTPTHVNARTMQPVGTPVRDWWEPIDDYTMDVDLPEHIDLLRDASDKALADDLAHGVPCG